MNYQGFFDQIRKNAVGSLYVFHGEEEYIKERALEKLVNALTDPSTRTVNYDVLEEEKDGGRIRAAAETLPFIAKRRLVVVKDSPLLREGRDETLEAYLGGVPESTCLVFYQRGSLDKRKKLSQLLIKQGQEVLFSPMEDRELVDYLSRYARMKGKGLNFEAAQLLILYAGRELQDLIHEIDKLSVYANGEAIGEADIKALVQPSLEYNIFQMTDHLCRRELGEALVILRGMLCQGQSGIGVLAMIYRQMRNLYRAKTLEKGANLASVLKLPPFVARKIAQQAGRFGEPELAAALRACREMDEAIKTGILKEDAALELLIQRIAGF